jgi:hypothetical protein
MLPAGCSFDHAFFTDTVVWSILITELRRGRKGEPSLFFTLTTPDHLADWKFNELGITRLKHPSDSSDLAHCDFGPFRTSDSMCGRPNMYH